MGLELLLGPGSTALQVVRELGLLLTFLSSPGRDVGGSGVSRVIRIALFLHVPMHCVEPPPPPQTPASGVKRTYTVLLGLRVTSLILAAVP